MTLKFEFLGLLKDHQIYYNVWILPESKVSRAISRKYVHSFFSYVSDI